MMQKPASLPTGSVVALMAVALAAVIRWGLQPILSETRPLITFYAAVAIAAWYGGLRPGIAAIVLSYLAADWLFIEQRYRLELLALQPNVWAEFVIYSVMGGVIVGLSESMHIARATAEREAQRAEQNKKILQVTLTSIGDGVITTDAQGRITLLNSVAQQLTGWSNVEAQQQPLPRIFRIVSERTRQVVEDPCSKVLRTGTIVGLANHTLLIAKDGNELPIDDSAAPIFDELGNIHGVVLVFRDDSQRRAAYEGLQRLAAIVEQSYDAVIGKTIDGTITNWNAAAERLFGFSANEAVGKHISFIVPPELRDEHKRVLQRLQNGERVEHWDSVRLRKDGSPVDVSLQISPIKNSYGEVIGASKIARDITDRKRVETSLEFLARTSVTLAELVDQQSALQQAVGSMVPFFADWCAVYLAGPDGQFEFQTCAHRESSLSAALPSMLRQMPGDRWLPNAEVTSLANGKARFVDESPPVVCNQKHEQSEDLDRVQPRSLIAAPLRIRDRLIGVMVFAATTSRPSYEPRDLSMADDLAYRVAVALENARLYHSVKAADRQKDEFLAMLAHELRNPLAAIQYATELARLPSAESQDDLLNLIERQVRHLARLIDDLLDISRISRGKIELRRDTIDVAALARQAAAAVRPFIDDKQHTLTMELPDEPLVVDADATRIEQIIVNLLTNAAKYTPAGGRIKLSAKVDSGEALIQVQDSGIGIATEMLPHVFELFTQGDKSLDRSEGGLGIGLTVVRKLTEMHGGSVVASSGGLGKGAEFNVRLPLSHGTAVAQQSAVPAAPLPPRNRRVLIVEDNLDTAHAAALLFQSHGHLVELAHNGNDAVELASQFRPEVMVIDIGLPGMNGYDVALAIGQRGLTGVTLIAVSGYGQAEDRERSLAAGFNHHLAKPVNFDALLNIVSQISDD